MGGKIRRFQEQRAAKKLKKEIGKGDKNSQPADTQTSKEEKRLLSKMPMKEQAKAQNYFPDKKTKKKQNHPFNKSKRTSPGDIELGEGPRIPHLQGKKRERQIESKTLENSTLLNKKMTKKAHRPRKK